MRYALIAYPLSHEYRKRLEEAVGFVPEYLTVAELRREALPQLLRRLRSLKADVLLLPMEDAGSKALLPLLCGLAAVAGARRTEVVNPDMSRDLISRFGAAKDVFSALMASAQGWASVRRCQRELKALVAAPPQRVVRRAGELLYLKTNLWFGIKAGGSVGHVAGVVNSLVRCGLKVRFLATEEPVMVSKQAEYVPIAPPAVYGIPSEVNLYRFHESFLESARKLIKNDRVSMIYQRLSVGNYVGPVLARELNVPLIIEYNGSEAWVQKNWGRPLRYHDLAVMAEDACLRHAHVVVTVSDVLRDELVARGVPPERIATYPNCIEPEVFDPARFDKAALLGLMARYGIADSAKLITFIGTFGQWHGVEVLAEAVRILVDTCRPLLDATGAHFMLVGDGLKYPQVKERLSDEPYRSYVTLTGLVPQDQAPLHLAASDILVSPHVPNADGSRFFGSPTKLFEYMAMGKPILASRLEQIGDIFRGSPSVAELDGSGVLSEAAMALLTEPGNAEELAAGIRILLEKPEWHAPLGARARAEALSRYTWDHHVEHVLQVLDTSVVAQSDA